jgi:5-methylcytosine-specific restriction enzyme A
MMARRREAAQRKLAREGLRRPCLECSRPTTGTRCEQHQQAYNKARLDTPTQRQIRNSPAWRRLSAQVLRREPLCRECRSEGKVTLASEVHHPDPRALGGALLPPIDELVPLCHRHHGRVTMAERYRGGGGPSNSGVALTSQPWSKTTGRGSPSRSSPPAGDGPLVA